VPDYIGQDSIQRPIRHANEYWDCYGVGIHDELRDTGDLLFFSRDGSFPTHIGIVRDPESYIHAPGKDGTRVEVKPITYSMIVNNGMYRTLYNRNPIGFKSPVVVVEEPTYRYQRCAI
jgi:cell wall-associated NlpC family hydrolase